MKLQNLAIIFIIIILPISLVLSYYTQSRVKTLDMQLSYDTRLNNATYDAVKAFQINTLNSDTSNQANSKIRDIQASVNTFFNSMKTNFSMNGYSKEILQTHVPALVYTLYDGYYIYSPYQNTLDAETIKKLGGQVDSNGNIRSYGNADSGYVYDLKPYVYYSCRYVKSGVDVVITYSLDSYITIKGKVDNVTWDEKGYLLSDVTRVNDKYQYRGVTIDEENGNLNESVVIDGQVRTLPYRKVNGVKYYLLGNDVYTVTNGKSEKQSDRTRDFVLKNDNAVNYYAKAYELKNKILGSSLRDLKASNAVDENGKPLVIANGTQEKTIKNDIAFNEYNIFSELGNTNTNQIQIEDSNSNFNAHRFQVIKRSIVRNLSIAITDFNNYSTNASSSRNFQFEMPQLKDTDWEKVVSNIGMVSFLQGLNIGGKVYNGYSIVVNNKNKEFVSEESIYIEKTGESIYHRVDSLELAGMQNGIGYFNIDYEKKNAEMLLNGAQITGYYNAREPATACYQCVVRQQNVYTGNLRDWLNSSGNAQLKKIYYTALARERYGLYRVENDV